MRAPPYYLFTVKAKSYARGPEWYLRRAPHGCEPFTEMAGKANQFESPTVARRVYSTIERTVFHNVENNYHIKIIEVIDGQCKVIESSADSPLEALARVAS